MANDDIRGWGLGGLNSVLDCARRSTEGALSPDQIKLANVLGLATAGRLRILDAQKEYSSLGVNGAVIMHLLELFEDILKETRI